MDEVTYELNYRKIIDLRYRVLRFWIAMLNIGIIAAVSALLIMDVHLALALPALGLSVMASINTHEAAIELDNVSEYIDENYRILRWYRGDDYSSCPYNYD